MGEKFMNSKWFWVRWILFLATVPCVRNAQSTLKVAACSSGGIPYVSILENGTVMGFDIDLWQRAFSQMQIRVAALKASGSIRAHVDLLDVLVGSSPPDLLLLSSESIEEGLANKSLDIGMCGFTITQCGSVSRLQNFDFTTPYLPTGLQAAVPKNTQRPSLVSVMIAIFGTIDSKAQLVFVILMLFLVIFGHLIAAAENFGRTSDDDEAGQIRNSYVGGSQDVGLGDIVPKTVQGKLLTLGWMIISIAMISMLYAVVTTNFGNLTLAATDALLQVSSPSDLSMYTLGTSLDAAEPVLRAMFPGPMLRLRNFPPTVGGQLALFLALLNRTIDVAIDRPEVIHYYASAVPGLQDRIRATGPVFIADSVAFAVRRHESGGPHPVLSLLSLAVADAAVTDWQWTRDTAAAYFGAAPQGGWSAGGGGGGDGTAESRESIEADTINEIKYQALATLLAFALTWAAVSLVTTVRRLPEMQAVNHTCEVVRWMLDIRDSGPHQSQKSLARMKTEVEAGLARLLTDPPPNLYPHRHDPPNPSAAAAAGQPPAEPSHLVKRTQTLSQWRKAAVVATDDAEGGGGGQWKAAGHPGGAGVGAKRRSADPCSLRMSVEVFVHCVAGKLAEERPRAGWWKRLTQLDYSRHGTAFVRGMVLRSYQRVENLIDDWMPPSQPGMTLSVDAAADVIVDMLLQETAPLLQGGALRHAPMDPQRAAIERGFDQVFRHLRVLHGRVDAVSRSAQRIEQQSAAACGSAE